MRYFYIKIGKIEKIPFDFISLSYLQFSEFKLKKYFIFKLSTPNIRSSKKKLKIYFVVFEKFKIINIFVYN
jgi:hypothetical protein